MFVANFAQLPLNDGENARLLREDVAQVLDRINQFLVFALDLFAFQTG